MLNKSQFESDRIKAHAFSGCSSLTSVTIPDSVKEIDENAFSDCENLRNINIPNRVKRIPQKAFYGCSSLEKIGKDAFSGTALPKELIDALHNKVKENGGIIK